MSASIPRREALKIAGVAGASALGGALIASSVRPDVEQKAKAAPSPVATGPGFFTPHERRTVEVLVDDILPPDERSGSATDAGVPDFMEAMLQDDEVTTPLTPVEMRGGLAWLDGECRRRCGRAYAECPMNERYQVLDDIASPKKARREMQYGAYFFSKMRDFTASGFFSSEMGYDDLRFQGNVATQWDGCPEEALRRLGVSYAAWDARYGRPEAAASPATPSQPHVLHRIGKPRHVRSA